MSRESGQKLRLIRLYRILYEKTDEQHPMTADDLARELDGFQIEVERKTLYNDIDSLIYLGADVVKLRGKEFGYYIGQREFELPELLLLADAVASSRFITERKSDELIGKIMALSSKYQAKLLKRQIYIVNRAKNQNEKIYYNIDVIHAAITQNRQITFKYFDYGLDKEKHFRRDGERYRASPFSLCWNDDNYYLVAYYPTYDTVSNFRVDKMESIELSDEPRQMDKLEGFDANAYAERLFSMFGGETERVRLEFADKLIGVVFDRFGRDVPIERGGSERFTTWVDVAVSPTFFGWLVQFGTDVSVLAPQSVRERFISFLNGVTGMYGGQE